MDNETLIYFGGSVKAIGDGRIAGFLCVYGDEKHTDLEGDYFTENTDFDLTGSDKRFGYYSHGMDVKVGNQKIGLGEITAKDDGLWLEAQLDLRNSYASMVYDLAEKGAMGLSSGALSHLVRREQTGKSFKITHWPLGEWSCTPTPAEVRTFAIPVKSLLTIPPIEEDEEEPEVKNIDEPKPEAVPAPDPNPVLKGLFESELAERQMSTWDLWSVLCRVFAEIAKAASTTDVTGVPVDVQRLVTEATSSFASRLVPAVVDQIADYTEGDHNSEFYLKGFERSLLQSFLANGSVASHGLFLDHSEEMASVAAEFAKEAGAVLDGLQAYQGRAERKAKFRADTKSGRMISQANLDFIDKACGDLKNIADRAMEIHGSLIGLMDAAKPKPKEEMEMPGHVVGQKSEDIERLQKLRMEFLRFEAANLGIAA